MSIAIDTISLARVDDGAKGEQGIQGEKGETGASGAKMALANVKYGSNDYYGGYSEAQLAAIVDNKASDNFVITNVSNFQIGDLALCKCVASDTKRATYLIGKITELLTSSINITVIGQTTGLNGAAGNGVKSSTIDYQIAADGTTKPTAWQETIPTTTAEKPYLWSRTTINYTDGTSSVTYSVGGQIVAAEELIETAKTELSNQIKAQTNYFWHDDEGAHVSNVAGDATSGKNVLIDSDSLDIRDGANTVASFEADKISLGKASDTGQIDMLNGALYLEGKYDEGSTRGSYAATLGTKRQYCSVNMRATANTTEYSYITASSEPGVSAGMYSRYDDSTASVSVSGGPGGSNIWLQAENISFERDTEAIDFFTVPRENFKPLVKGVLSAPVVLFDNENASVSGATTLSETAANFDDLEIFYKSDNGYYSSVRVHDPDGKNVCLMSLTVTEANAYWLKGRAVYISGTTIDSIKSGSNWRRGQVNAAGSNSGTLSDYIAITRVIGWRKANI